MITQRYKSVLTLTSPRVPWTADECRVRKFVRLVVLNLENSTMHLWGDAFCESWGAKSVVEIEPLCRNVKAWDSVTRAIARWGWSLSRSRRDISRFNERQQNIRPGSRFWFWSTIEDTGWLLWASISESNAYRVITICHIIITKVSLVIILQDNADNQFGRSDR